MCRATLSSNLPAGLGFGSNSQRPWDRHESSEERRPILGRTEGRLFAPACDLRKLYTSNVPIVVDRFCFTKGPTDPQNGSILSLKSVYAIHGSYHYVVPRYDEFAGRRFDWDDGNRAKCQKHGVSIAQIEALFAHNPRIAPDPKHSADEDRLIAVGRTSAGLAVFVAFTIRTKNKRRVIRPVTARYMHAKEIAAYEKESSTTENR